MTSVVSANPKPMNGKNDPSDCSPTKKSNGKRKSASLPSETVEYLKAWMMSPEHIAHPYPTEQEKVDIMKDTKIELKQLTNWFVNNRKRYWKPRVEARLQQQAQAAQAAVQAHAAAVAAVSVTNCLPQQQQVLPGSTPDINRANLVSPQVSGFKFSHQVALQSQQAKPPLLRFDTSHAAPSPTQQHSFASQAMAVASHASERRWKPVALVSGASTVATGASNGGSETSSTSAASVSASEGELSDTGNTSDDASSDGSKVLGKDLNFINLKMKKHKYHHKSKSSDTTSALTSAFENSQETTYTSTNYTRNVSFCSLDKIAAEVTSASTSQESETTCSSDSKKRIIDDIDLPLVVATAPPTKRFRTVSIDVWRKKCQDAAHVHDEALPSLEEATRLFGFTSA